MEIGGTEKGKSDFFQLGKKGVEETIHTKNDTGNKSEHRNKRYREGKIRTT